MKNSRRQVKSDSPGRREPGDLRRRDEFQRIKNTRDFQRKLCENQYGLIITIRSIFNITTI